MRENVKIKERLIRLLQISGPVKNKMLASMLKLSERHTRELIQELRHAKYPIAFCLDGYFLATNKDELQHTINKFRVKNHTTVSTLFDLENADYDITKLRDRDRKRGAK